jgi:cytochrome c oxidase subunit 2
MAAASGAYKTCAACHGATGLGNAALQAPALVNLDADYLERQVRHFRDGIRGRHPEDRWGQQMSDQAALLKDDSAIAAVVAQIEGFPNEAPAVTLKADLQRGEGLYGSTCGACHGPGAEGIPVLGAPSLRGIDDWYLARQYRNFRDGIRGTHEDDRLGQQMQRMGMVLKDEQDIQAVSAWIASLDIDE